MAAEADATDEGEKGDAGDLNEAALNHKRSKLYAQLRASKAAVSPSNTARVCEHEHACRPGVKLLCGIKVLQLPPHARPYCDECSSIKTGLSKSEAVFSAWLIVSPGNRLLNV